MSADPDSAGAMTAQAGRGLFAATVAAMFLVEGLLYAGTIAMPIAAPDVAVALGLEVALLGLYMALLFGTAMVTSLLGGGLAARWGGIRLAQACLLIDAAGLALISLGAPALIAVAALLLGIGQAGSIPATSQILIRVAPPRLTAIAFSIKETGVPAAGMAAGVLVPALVAVSGWADVFLVAAAACGGLAVALIPLGRQLDDGPDGPAAPGPGAFLASLRLLVADPRLRALTLGAASFIGTQIAFATFFIAYLVQGLGFGLATAGGIYAVSQAVAVVSRILWGWVADRFSASGPVLGGLGVAMFAGAVLTALFTRDWTVTAIAAVAIGFALAAYGWSGVLWAEIARAVPVDRVGAMTGATVSLVFATAMLFPALFGALLAATGRYGVAFVVSALPALLVGLFFLRAARRGPGRA